MCLIDWVGQVPETKESKPHSLSQALAWCLSGLWFFNPYPEEEGNE